MKPNRLILSILAISALILLQTGCQEQPTASNTQPAIAAAPVTKSKLNSTITLSPTGAEQAKSNITGDTGTPKIMFDELIHDFGKIAPGTVNHCEFKFTNVGDGTLKVNRKILSTCGCTVPKLAKEEYAPGEHGTVKVEYHAGSRAGLATRHLVVRSNDKERPKVQLTIKAKVVKKVECEPTRLNLSLKKENAGCPEIKLTSLDDQPFAIKAFTTTCNCITADFNPSEQAKSFVLQPKVNIEKLKKVKDGRIDIFLTHPQCDKVSVYFSVLTEFSTKPPLITVLDAKPQQPTTRELFLLNNYNEEFEVQSTSSRKGIVKVLSQEKLENRYKFQLQITPPAINDNKQRYFSDVFTIKMKGGDKVNVTCYGFYSQK